MDSRCCLWEWISHGSWLAVSSRRCLYLLRGATFMSLIPKNGMRSTSGLARNVGWGRRNGKRSVESPKDPQLCVQVSRCRTCLRWARNGQEARGFGCHPQCLGGGWQTTLSEVLLSLEIHSRRLQSLDETGWLWSFLAARRLWRSVGCVEAHQLPLQLPRLLRDAAPSCCRPSEKWCQEGWKGVSEHFAAWLLMQCRTRAGDGEDSVEGSVARGLG